jgi:hemoglobin-like flavoprotein
MAPDLETLETSFDLIAPRGEELVDIFYRGLFDSMAEVAGEAWTQDVAAAWAGALGLVATAMLEGAEDAESCVGPRIPVTAVAPA